MSFKINIFNEFNGRLRPGSVRVEWFVYENPRKSAADVKPTEGISEEWAIIELQGDIKSHTDSSLEGQYIGNLHFTKSGTPLLIIGHHLMYGKEAKLEKPFALLHKKKTEDNTEYLVEAIIRNKIIFKTRPKPIVGKQD